MLHAGAKPNLLVFISRVMYMLPLVTNWLR